MKPNKAKLLFALPYCILLLVAAWMLGGNLPPVRTAALAVIALLLAGLCLFARMLGAPSRTELLLRLTLIAGIGFAAFQLWPGNEETLSQYPAATRARLCELIMAVAAFFCASIIFSDRNLTPWLFGIIAFNGVVVTFFGLAQVVSQTEKLFWFYELIHGGVPFGPFVNGNNAGGYLLMCFAAANFFLARRVFQTRAPDESSTGKPKESFVSAMVQSIGRGFARMETRDLYVFAAMATIAAGVFATLSRGASVALVISLIIGWAFLFRRSWKVVVASAAILACGIGLLFWTQQNDAVVANIQSLSDLQSASKQRIEHWQDAMELASDQMPFGSGLGTYSVMYPPYQETHFKRWFKHAENQYLEAFAEMGVVGISVLLLVVAIVFIACFSLISKPDSTTRAVGVTGIICLVSQAIAGFLDFGLYQPANALLMATIVGAVFGQHNWYWTASNLNTEKSPKIRAAICWLLSVVMLAAVGWATYEYSAVDARRAGRRFNERFEPERDRDQLQRYQEILEYATRIRPDDSEAHYHLALNRVLQYRMAAVDEMLAPMNTEDSANTPEQVAPTAERQTTTNSVAANQTNEPQTGEQTNPTTGENNLTSGQEGPVSLDMDPSNATDDFKIADAWPTTTLLSLHRMAKMAAKVEPQAFEQLVNSQPVATHLTAAWDELLLAEKCCDKFWMTQLRLAQLSSLMGETENEQAHLDQAIERCPNNSKLLYAVGLLKHQSGEAETACKLWNRCLELTREFDEPIILFCRFELGIKAFFEQVLPVEPNFRIRIARKFFGSPQDLLLKKMLLGHTKSVIKKDEHEEAEYKYLMAEMERLSENYAVSMFYFKKALELEKNNANWRVQYARCLISAEKFDDAITELKLCQLYHGDHHSTAERLLRMTKQLRVKAIKSAQRY